MPIRKNEVQHSAAHQNAEEEVKTMKPEKHSPVSSGGFAVTARSTARGGSSGSLSSAFWLREGAIGGYDDFEDARGQAVFNQ